MNESYNLIGAKLFKSHFRRQKNLLHFNNAGLSPISNPAREKIKYWADRFYEEGFWTDHDYMADVKTSRGYLAQLIGCQSDEIAFFQNTSSAISQFAFNCGLKADDEVLMWSQEYSSHLYPWQEACKRSGAILKLVDSEDLSTDTEKFAQALTNKTRVVAFSWVQFLTGSQMTDLEAFIKHCKSKGVLIFVDVMQGLGILPEQLWHYGVDGVAGGSHKWLVSPVGVGFLAVRSELANQLRPQSYGAYTFGTCDDPSDLFCSPKKDASRFESGSKQVLEITALGASCKMLLECDINAIYLEATRLSNYLDQQLQEIGFKTHNPNIQKSSSESSYSHPIVNFHPPSGVGLELISQQLKAHNINFAIRGPGIRLSPQAFNEAEEVDFIIDCLKKMTP